MVPNESAEMTSVINIDIFSREMRILLKNGEDRSEEVKLKGKPYLTWFNTKADENVLCKLLFF